MKKMDERELSLRLKVFKVCYISLSITIVFCFLLAIFNVFENKESMYLSIIMIVDAITYTIASIKYSPDRIDKNEK